MENFPTSGTLGIVLTTYIRIGISSFYLGIVLVTRRNMRSKLNLFEALNIKT